MCVEQIAVAVGVLSPAQVAVDPYREEENLMPVIVQREIDSPLEVRIVSVVREVDDARWDAEAIETVSIKPTVHPMATIETIAVIEAAIKAAIQPPIHSPINVPLDTAIELPVSTIYSTIMTVLPPSIALLDAVVAISIAVPVTITAAAVVCEGGRC